MKVKEIDRTANIAWSPAGQHPIHLATGTAAQQLDASFSTTSSLEIYELNLQEPGLDMRLTGSVTTEHRFHKLAWGAFGSNPSGVVVGGCDGGNIFLYDPAKLFAGEGESLSFQKDKHSGPVRALDFNPFQANLLASGASESEILIWDLNNPNSPMTPGAKSQPSDDVTCIAWNQQVQHILASTFATRCVVWDLRKNEPIIKVSGSTSRMKCSVIAWHPEVATQMCLASEDDHTPFIQLWDLRFATSPLKTMENHQRGILSLAWCAQDPDLLLSCGKDNQILCWNPNTEAVGGEVICEIPTSSQWNFDVAWCPRNPGIISNCSFDGHVSVYSLMGGRCHDQPSSKVTEAFMGASFSLQGGAPQVHRQQEESTTVFLSKPPKWLKRPVGASFGFGGKLVTFELIKQTNPANPTVVTSSSLVHVSQVVTDPDLINRAVHLEKILTEGQFVPFCDLKIDNCTSPSQRQIWEFLRASFDENAKNNFLTLLGHKADNVPVPDFDVNGDVVSSLEPESPIDAFEAISQHREREEEAEADIPFVIPKDDDTSGSIANLLLSGNMEAAVHLCLEKEQIVEALLLAMAGGDDLLSKVQRAYFKRNANNSLTKLVSAVVMGSWQHLVSTCSLESWKEALAGALVYANPDEFPLLSETLGQRLEKSGSSESKLEAMLCYICAGNVPKLVGCWSETRTDSSDPNALQDLVEQVSILRLAVTTSRKKVTETNSDDLAAKLRSYSQYLAAQGNLSNALLYLQESPDGNPEIDMLKYRLSRALGIVSDPSQASRSHVQVTDTKGKYVKPQSAPTAPAQPAFANRGRTVEQSRFSNSPAPLTTTYVAPTVPAVSATKPAAKSHLSNRYPAHVADSSVYGSNVPYSQPGTFDPMHNFGVVNQPNYSTPYNPYGPPETQSMAYNSGYSGYDYRQPQQSQYETQSEGSFTSGASVAAYHADNKPGWNDPPMLNQNKLNPEYDAPPPITHPLFSGPQEPNMPPTSYGQPAFGHISQQPSVPVEYMNQAYAPQAPAPEPQVVRPSRIQESPKIKAPIPGEHQVLHDIFENLKAQCLTHSTNMQMKRKLDDVTKKLEVLYDKLRENELCSNTILGLHQIVQMVQQRDYQVALNIHTQIVTTGAFSEISGFMPGLKVLLQTAMQLGVYI